MSQREDEVFAKDRFDRFIRERGVVDPKWKDGDQNSPPDFYLTIDQDEYAVEVTTLVENIETPRNPVPRTTIDQTAKEFVQDVEQTAIKRGILSGTYFVSFDSVDKDFYGQRKKLKKKLLKFIADTQTVHGLEDHIEIDGVEYLSVQKTLATADKVIVGIFPPDAKWEGPAMVEACQLLQDAISQKGKRLLGFSQQKILLLIAKYVFVDPEDYRHCLKQTVNDLDSFHSIFIIIPFNWASDYILHTTYVNWRSGGPL